MLRWRRCVGPNLASVETSGEPIFMRQKDKTMGTLVTLGDGRMRIPELDPSISSTEGTKVDAGESQGPSCPKGTLRRKTSACSKSKLSWVGRPVLCSRVPPCPEGQAVDPVVGPQDPVGVPGRAPQPLSLPRKMSTLPAFGTIGSPRSIMCARHTDPEALFWSPRVIVAGGGSGLEISLYKILFILFPKRCIF